MTGVAQQPGARIELPSLPNFRDLGGYPVAGGGRVRRGALYRSVELNHLHGEDLATFAAMGIRTVVDLRTQAERDAQPDVVPDGTETVVCDVLAGMTSAAPADLLRVIADPAAAEDLLGEGKALALFEGAYRDIVSLPSALDAYRRFFTLVAEGSKRPLLFHCTTGKDRTGWAAAAALLLLGVSEDDVRADYLFTNRDLLPALKPVFEQFRAAGGDPTLLEPVLGVDVAYLDTALTEMRLEFGDIEGYFVDGLGLDRDVVDSLRRDLVECTPG
jgi:protein-tyrosine phosphatase